MTMLLEPSVPGETDTLLRERMTIRGELDADSFLPWIRRHASKLGLFQDIVHSGPDRIEVDLAGAPELIDMMEVGCLLGPINVWVETIDRRRVSNAGG